MKCERTLSEKVMLLKLNLEFSTGKHLEIQFSARMWELSQILFTEQYNICIGDNNFELEIS